MEGFLAEASAEAKPFARDKENRHERWFNALEKRIC
jgi:hypothetical protein